MRTPQFVLRTIILSIFLIVVVSCSASQPETPPDTPEPALTQTPTPTYAVALLDSGAPLEPKVLATSPDGGQELAASGAIEVVFDQPMDLEETTQAWSLLAPDGQKVPGEIQWPDAATLVYWPKEPLERGQVYRAVLSIQTTSAEGVHLSEPIRFDINVAGELQVSQVFPAAGTQEVAGNASITVIFNRPVVPLAMVEAQAGLPQPLTLDPEIAGEGEWLSTSVYIFQPAEALQTSTVYSARIAAGLSDVLGNELPQDYIWQFTTAAPSISAFGLHQPNTVYYPENNYQNVYLESSFVIEFHQPMEAESTEQAFSLNSQAGETVAVEFDWITDQQLVITPTRQLSLGTDYTLILSENARTTYGGALADGLRWNFRTLLPPAIVGTTPKDDAQPTYFSDYFSVQFASPMRLDTIETRVIITPAPEEPVQWYYDRWSWRAEFYGLKAATNYTIEFLPGMEDIYGNQIATGSTVSFRTGIYQPSARFDLPYAPSIYRSDGPQTFYASYVNVDNLEFSLFRLSAADFAGFTSGYFNTWNFVPPDDNLLSRWQVVAEDVANQRVRLSRPLETSDGQPLSPGFYFLTLDSPDVAHDSAFLDTRLIVVANANLTYKATTAEVLLWVTDLESGAPLADVPLEVYDGNSLIAQGSTNSDGWLKLSVPPQDYESGARYAVTATGGPMIYEPGVTLAFALASWGSGVSPWDFGIWSDYYSQAEQPTVYAYTDRPLYRPGQTVYFKGILRLNADLDYSLLPWEEVEILISDYSQTIYQEVLSISAYGSFDGQLLLDENAALGNYWMEVRRPGSTDAIGGVSFNVAEYRKPEFQVLVTPDESDVLGGEEMQITVLAEYYSGGSVSQADVEWAVRAEDYFFQPPGELSSYSFSDFDWDQYFYMDGWGAASKIIAQGEGQTDDQGQLLITVPAELADAQGSRQFTIEATLTDFAGTTVSNRTQVVGHQAEYYPGIKSGTYVGQQGESQTFDLVLVDWNANPVAGQSVQVEIVERRWSSVQEQDVQGYVRWVSTVEEILVETYDDVRMNQDGEAQVEFIPSNGGVYKAYVTVRDEQGNEARSAAYMWVASEAYIPWRVTDDRRIDLVADQEIYQPGDTAEILIASPFSGENYALVTVERGQIRQQEVIRLASNSVVYRLPITADMAPNVYVSVVVIKGAQRDGVPDFRMGITELSVDTGQQAITVEITPDREQAGPGDQVTYSIRTTDFQGKPLQAELSISVADLATLSLAAPNSQPILDYFYGERSLNVRTVVPIVLNIEHYLETLEDQLTDGQGGGSGGGKGVEEFGIFDVRQDFPDTAYWEARIITDPDGQAEITVTLPDNLTIWRLDGRAITLDTRVGDTLVDLRSTKPLLIRPQTPRFFVNGDRATLGAAVHNNSAEDLTVTVALEAGGVAVNSPASQKVEIAAGGQAYLSWQVTVLAGVERADLLFTARAGEYSDATRPTLATLDGQGIPVYRYQAPETVGTSGLLSAPGSRTEGISLPGAIPLQAGELTVHLAPSLAAGMLPGLDYLEHYPYECIEQTVSSFLPNVLSVQALQGAGLSDPALEAALDEQVSAALQRLYNSQRADGGWGWWPQAERSDALTSAYVVMGLVEAQKAGYPVSNSALQRALNYLRGSLRSVAALDSQTLLNRQAFVLYVLARAGDPQPSQVGRLFDIRQSLSLYARAYLAEALYRIDSTDPRLDTLLSDFANAAVRSASGTHWEEDWDDYWNWNTDTRTTAVVLATLVQVWPESELNPNAVRWLMSNRDQGRWTTTQETAWSLMALTGWLTASGELQADYNWAVGLNGDRLADGAASSDQILDEWTVTVDLPQLLVDTVNRLTIGRDEGSGNLYYTAFLTLDLPVEQLEPLDRGLIVSRQYFLPEDRSTPVSQATRGDLLLARLTVVVPHDLHYVIVHDPLPAGLEAVDRSLLTSPDVTAPEAYDIETQWRQGWGWWYFQHVEFRDEAVVLSADYLPAGTYVYTYLVRAGTAGEFRVIPPTAQEFYFPDVYGRGAGSLFIVKP